MGGVTTPHEAGTGLLAERGAEHLGIEGGSLGFIDALPGRDRRELRRQRHGGGRPDAFQGRLGLNARHVTLVAVTPACDQSRARDERVLILALIAADRPLECHKRRPLSRVGAVQNPEIAHLGVWACWANVDSSRAAAQIP